MTPNYKPITELAAVCQVCGTARRATDQTIAAWGGTRRLKCATCQTTTQHGRAQSSESDFREATNVRQNTTVAVKLWQIQTSIAMIEKLGVGFRFSSIEPLYHIDCDRGPGWITWTVTIADDLSLDQQLEALRDAWSYLLPARMAPWGVGDWVVNQADPNCSYRRFEQARTKKSRKDSV